MNNKLSLLVNFIGVDKMSGALKNIIGLGHKGGRSLKQMEGAASKLNSQMAKLQREIARGGDNMGELAQRERELAAEIRNVNREMDRKKKLLAIEGDRRAMIAKGDDWQSRGRDNVVGGVSMLAPFALAAKAGMDYEKKLALLAQKTDLTKQETEALGGQLLRVARKAKLMPDAVLEGADFLASKGLGVEEIQRSMPAIAQFSRAWDANVNDAAKASYANFLSLKVPLGQTARALEVMGVAGKQGGFEVKDMAQHFPILASSFATLGGEGLDSVASLSAALQVLEAKTGDGALAANDLANLMRFVQTGQGQKNFKAFGIDIVSELKKAEAEGGDALERLAALIDKTTGGDDAKIATLITDSQAGRGALSLVQSIDKYRKIRDAAFAAQGVTAAEFERMSETSEANWTQAKGAMSGLATILGARLLPHVTKGINAFARMVDSVADWAEENPRTASTLMQLIGGIALLRIGLGTAQFALGGLLKPLASVIAFTRNAAVGNMQFLRVLVKARRIWRTTAGVAKTAFTLIRSSVMFMAKGIIRAGLMMMANPAILGITLLVLGLAAAAYAIYKHWDTIKAAFRGAVAAVGAAWTQISAAFDRGISNVRNMLSGLSSWLKAIGTAMMQGLLLAINPMALGKKLIDMAKNGIAAFKNYLGIKSPSRVFMAIGGHTAEGMALGIERGGRRAISAAGRLAAGVTAAGTMALTPVGASATANGGGPSRSSESPAAAAPITIHVHGAAGQSEERLAEIVMRKLRQQKGIDARSSYEEPA